MSARLFVQSLLLLKDTRERDFAILLYQSDKSANRVTVAYEFLQPERIQHPERCYWISKMGICDYFVSIFQKIVPQVDIGQP